MLVLSQEPYDKISRPAPLLKRPPSSGALGGMGGSRPWKYQGSAMKSAVGKEVTQFFGAIWGREGSGERGW